MSYQLTTLDNGLRIATEALPQMETVGLAISVDVGARWEQPDQHGISHVLEHMAFKGTPRFTALQIAEQFDDIGGQFNAYTSHEHTVYHARLLAKHWQIAADILCDILQYSLFDETELAREQEVILQELAMHEDTPEEVVFEQFQALCFGAEHPLGRSVLGTAESIQRVCRQQLLQFVQKHYTPSRIVVSAAGAVEHQAMVDFFAEHLSLAAIEDADMPQQARFVGGQDIRSKALEQLQLIVGVPSVTYADQDYYAAQLVTQILGGGMSSRLFQQVREQRGLVYAIQAMHASYQDVGVCSVYAATSQQHGQEVLDLIRSIAADLPHSLAEEELARAKQQTIANLRMARENTMGMAEWIGRHLLQYGEYRSADELQQRLEAITLEQCRHIAQRLFVKQELAIAALGPKP